MKRAFFYALLFWSVGCTRAPLRSLAPSQVSLLGTDGRAHTILPAEPDRLNVVVFFSEDCHCFAAHEERLREWANRYRAKGVQFLAVDSESGATLEHDREIARKRGYPFPIVVDTNATLARRLGAEYATFAVIVDRAGTIAYRGGLDSDKTHLTDDAEPWLRDAIDALLSGRAPRRDTTKSLGCALRTH